MVLRATPPGEDGIQKARSEPDLYQAAAEVPFANQPAEEGEPQDIDYLNLLSQAITQGQTYITQNVRNTWERSIRAFRNQHFQGSKYLHKDFKARSSIFRPKTRAAVRKDMAAAASSLFSTTDAISCEAGDEGNPQQRASAAIIKELLNYRTDRTSGKAAIPWFRVAMGARQDAVLQSVCVSKQSWKLERRSRTVQQPAFSLDETTGEPIMGADGNPVPMLDEFGEPVMDTIEVMETIVDRPDCTLVPLENVIIDPAADWLDPIQSSSYWIVKYPMRKFDIEAKQRAPQNPWKKIDWSKMRADRTKTDSQGVRIARDGGQDRFDQTNTGTGDFEVFWVFEVFMRVGDEDMHFWSADDKQYLTDPTPVDEIYPAFEGERPYTWGVASLEAHKLFPMSPVESWQPMQQEINDLANLRLDQVKLNVSPVAKVKRGRNVDLAALQRKGPNSSLLVQDLDDIDWDRPPEVPSSAYAEMERLNADFDDLAGQFNSGSVQTNRSMNETVGGLKLIAGNANTVGEFDLRTWIETWVEPTLAQIVKLLQFYESDERIIGLCGDRAKLFQKFGVSQIDDKLLSEQVTVRVNVGIGNGSPQERLGKFAAAIQTLTPIAAASKEFQSGEIVIDFEEAAHEVFGLTGYRDGGTRFVKRGQPQQNPMADIAAQDAQAKIAKTMSEADKNKAIADKTRMDSKIEQAQAIHGAMMDRAQMVHQVRSEREGAVAQRSEAEANRNQRREEITMRQETVANNKAAGKNTIEQSAPQMPLGQEPSPADEQIARLAELMKTKRVRNIEFIRGPDGRITGARLADQADSSS